MKVFLVSLFLSFWVFGQDKKPLYVFFDNEKDSVITLSDSKVFFKIDGYLFEKINNYKTDTIEKKILKTIKQVRAIHLVEMSRIKFDSVINRERKLKTGNFKIYYSINEFYDKIYVVRRLCVGKWELSKVLFIDNYN